MTPPIDSLDDKINKGRLQVGNKVLDSDKTDLSSSEVGYQLGSDSSGGLTAANATTGTPIHAMNTTSITTPLEVEQSTNSNPAMEIVGKGLEAAITGTIVYYGGSTVTQTGAIRILVTDSTGIGATTGYYYIPFGTLA